MDAGTVRFTLNGEPRKAPEGSRLLDLLWELGVDTERVALERNREVVPRERHGELVVEDGDVFEVVQFVGGG